MIASLPVVVTGMHRSGTSLIASYLQALGVNLGDELIEADANNPHGYFEAKDFVRLHQRMLARLTRDDEGGHPDWGWTPSEHLSAEIPNELVAAAEALAAKNAGRPIWGFKDPRTSVLLDFWDGVLDDARYVFLYRCPWDVADSMQRLGADVFLDHPDYAFKIWTFYNRRLLDFQRRHPDRVVLASTQEVIANPEAFVGLLSGKLGIELADANLDALIDAARFQTLDREDPLIYWVDRLFPEAIDTLRRLDAVADLFSAAQWKVPESPVSSLVFEGPVDVSVVSPCHNDGEFLVEAVASVERSLRKVGGELRCEQIIVNDGSSNARTLEILGHLRAAGLEVIDLEHGGLSRARNEGVQRARGRYVLPLDADNRLRSGLLREAVGFLDQNKDHVAVYGDCREFGLRNGRRITPELDFDLLLRGNYIDACSLIRKSAVMEQGGYDEGLSAWEDWDLWIRFVRSGWQIARSERLTFDYRVRPSSMLAKLESDPVQKNLMLRILSKHEECYRELLSRTSGHLVSCWPALLGAEIREQQQRMTDLVEAYAELEEHLQVLMRSNESLEQARQNATGLFSELEQSYEQLAQARDELEVYCRETQGALELREWELATIRSSSAVRFALALSRTLARARTSLAGWRRALTGHRQPSGS